MVISDLVRATEQKLSDNARFEAELMVMHCVGINRTELILNPKRELKTEHILSVENMLKRRLDGEPLQYILGETEFMSLDFYVKSGVLIPRADTELLVEITIDRLGKIDKENISVADMCTGSGCVGISLAHYDKNLLVDLFDISDDAIDVAKSNIIRNNVSDRVNVKKMDILCECPQKMYDVVVSNPPYIESDVIPTLQTEVRDFEPHLALDGGNDGLVFYRRIVDISREILCKNGFLAFEIGYNQGEEVTRIMQTHFCNVEVIKDLSGNDRVAVGMLKS